VEGGDNKIESRELILGTFFFFFLSKKKLY
jgi:hypothetical protein